MNYPNEWTQKEFLQNKKHLAKENIAVVLVDTILSPIEKAETITYNPYALKEYPKGSVFVFYCDTGKATLDRLEEYKAKFPQYHCISLKGGRGYWRKNMQLLDRHLTMTQIKIDEFKECLREERFYDAHEVLEAIWFPHRFETSPEVKLLKGFINAAVSFELLKKGKILQSKKIWANYLKYRQLLFKVDSPYLNEYYKLSRKIEILRYNFTI